MLSTGPEGATLGLEDGSQGLLPLAELTWARRALANDQLGPAVTAADQVVQPGDVVWVEPLAGADVTVAGADVTVANGNAKPARYTLRQPPEIEGAVVALDPHTGRVLAMSGGFSYAESVFNRATQALRQPGSAIKPFVYLAGLENGLTPSSILLDAPIVIDQGPGLGKWKPANYSGHFYGPSTLRLGLEKSRNLMTVRLAQATGMDKVVDMVHRFGIDRGMGTNLSAALGAGEVDLLSLTSAYASLVNGGKRIKPALIERIQDRHGKTVERRDDRPCPGCDDVAWQDQPTPTLVDQREQIIPAGARLPDGQPAPGRGRARHRRARADPGQAGRRQDRHLERFPRRLVHRLHPRSRGRRVRRLRPAPQPGRPGAGRDRRAADLHRGHAEGAWPTSPRRPSACRPASAWSGSTPTPASCRGRTPAAWSSRRSCRAPSRPRSARRWTPPSASMASTAAAAPAPKARRPGRRSRAASTEAQGFAWQFAPGAIRARASPSSPPPSLAPGAGRPWPVRSRKPLEAACVPRSPIWPRRSSRVWPC